MTRLPLLLALACSDYAAHPPDVGGYLDGDPCGRVPVAAYTAGDGECLRVQDSNGRALVKFADSESCGGPPCGTAQPGQTLLVLEKVKPAAEGAEWTVETVPCDSMCCGEYLGEWQCW